MGLLNFFSQVVKHFFDDFVCFSGRQRDTDTDLWRYPYPFPRYIFWSDEWVALLILQFVVFKMVVCLVLLIFRLVIGVIKLNGTFKFSFFHSHHLDRWWKMVKIMTWQFHGKNRKISHFFKNRFFMFLIISPVIFELQRHTIRQNNS